MLALVPLGTGAGADPTFVAGSGRARANLFEIVPRTGGLEIPINFGKALVTYQGFSATATSGGLKPPSQNAADGDCGGAQPPGGGGDGGAPAPPKPPGSGNGPTTTFPWVSTLSVSTGDKDAEEGRHVEGWDEPPVRDPDKLYDIIDVLVDISEGHGVSAAQVALTWLLGRPGVASIIVGARTDEQLADNLKAADLKLSEEERRRLDEVSAPPLIYPFWHQMRTASDRLGPADMPLIGPHLKDG